MSVHTLSFRTGGKKSERLDTLVNSAVKDFLTSRENNADVSRSKIRRLIIAGTVSVNGKQERRPERNIAPGTGILIRLDLSRFLFEKKPDDITFELSEKSVLFEDEWILVVNKPARFPSEATIVADRDHLHAACKRYLNRNGEHRNTPYCGLLHRLDRDTSGVILFSKTRTVNAEIHRQFTEKTIQKTYLALSLPTGRYPAFPFSVENHLGRISPKSAPAKWGAVTKDGDEAHTDFQLAEEKKELLLIKAFPRTGRTHQIRVHLSGEHLPILGDTLYGGAAEFNNTPVPRVMLHAAELSFRHPVSGEQKTVSAPLPEDFITIWEKL